MLSRRDLVTAAALTTAALADEKPAATSKLKVSVFSKHLQFLEGDALAKAAADIGFDGIDLAVRKGGHIEPARVREELPKLVAAIRRRGLEVTMLTTDIVDADTPFAEDVLKAMSELGIHHYRWGGFKYDPARPVPRQLDDLKPRVARLAALNTRYKATAMYHTHSGINLVGAPIWDLYIVLRDFDPNAVAVNYDIGHATVEGGFGGWIDSFNVTGPYMRGVAVKDFLWAKDAKGNWRPQWTPIGEGMVRFKQFFEMLAASHFSGPLQMHFEYPLSGAEATFAAMKRDLVKLRTYFTA